MLVILPYHTTDTAQAVKTLNLSAKLGFISNHQLILLRPNDVPRALADEVMVAAQKAFETVLNYEIPHNIQKGWPIGPNQMFLASCDLVSRQQPFELSYDGRYQAPNGHFLWLEPDAVPVHRGWLDRLEAEYQTAGKPCLGAIVPTIRREVLTRDEEGLPLTFGGLITEGEHMTGVGIYDRSIIRIITWMQALATLNEPFDQVLQGEILQREGSEYTRVVPSRLIAHFRKATNFRITRDGDMLEIEADVSTDEPSRNKLQLSRYGHVGAVLVHGCKDDSIYEIAEYVNGFSQTVENNSTNDVVSVRPAWKVVTDPKTIAEFNASMQSVMQSSPLTEPEDQSLQEPSVESGEQRLTESEWAAVFALRQKKENRGAKKHNAKKAKAPKSVKAVKAVKSKPVKALKEPRPEIDESAVWSFYSDAAKSENGNAWSATLGEFRLSPNQLKQIKAKYSLLV